MKKRNEKVEMSAGIISRKLSGTIKNIVCYERYGKIVMYQRKNKSRVKKHL